MAAVGVRLVCVIIYIFCGLNSSGVIFFLKIVFSVNINNFMIIRNSRIPEVKDVAIPRQNSEQWDFHDSHQRDEKEL